MKLPRRLLPAVLALAWLLPAFGAGESGPRLRKAPALDTANARVIVKYRENSSLMRVQSVATAKPQHAGAMGARLGLAMKDGWVLGPRTQALRAQGIGSAELVRRLEAQPDVEWAVVDGRKHAYGVVPNDPYYGSGQAAPYPAVGQWYLRAPDATFVAAINAVGAWSITTGSANITVAVLDTGIRPEHPDFKRADGSSKLYAGYDFIGPEPNTTNDFFTAGDGSGRDADPSDPGDACDGFGSSWHGTQTASLIGAATDNGIGMASVGREVMIQPVRVLGKCGGYDSDIIAGMRWAAGVAAVPIQNPHPAKVLNMSLGSDGACTKDYQDVFNELYAAGVTVVAAAGNGVDTPAPGGGVAVGTPANCPHAIAVAGVRHAGTKVGYSNLGPEVVIAAPAGNCVNTNGDCLYPILTATNAGASTPTTSAYTDMVDYAIGTSFSAPQVAGVVGLMLSLDASLRPSRIRDVLKATARPFPTSTTVAACRAPSATPQDECYCTTSTCGAGMLDARAAVNAVWSGGAMPPLITINASSTTPARGSSVTLDASGTRLDGGRTVATYVWSVTGGGDVGQVTGALGTPSTTVMINRVGEVTVQLVVTDVATNSSSTSSVTLYAQEAPPDNGGGGAMSTLWNALVGLAVVVLAWQRRHPRRT